MRNIFRYFGIISLMLFSFYFTEKVAIYMNKEDKLLQKINEYAKENNVLCTEGEITSEGVILGVNGKEVDETLSYQEMKFTGFDEKLIQYKENSCIVSKENNINDYIIKGSPSKNSISLIININSGKNISKLINITRIKEIKLSLSINKNYYDNNKEYINNLIKDGYDILYNGSVSELDDFKREFNYSFNCISINNKELLAYCSEMNVNTIKTKLIFSKDYLTNVKENIESGVFIVLEERDSLKEELGVIINYIKSKGYNIINVNNHLL